MAIKIVFGLIALGVVMILQNVFFKSGNLDQQHFSQSKHAGATEKHGTVRSNSNIRSGGGSDSAQRQRRLSKHHHHHKDDDGSRIYDPNDPRIRYAAFGSSSTWGAGYPSDKYDRHNFAYPWLLSKTATNLAIRAGGPNYPANCVNTMVGDDEYDVIILEYFMMAWAGLPLLARRLRERYPDALIIYLKNWSPFMIGAKVGNTNVHLNIHEWAEKNGFGGDGALLDPEMHKTFLKSNDEWAFYFDRRDDAFPMNQIIDDSAAEIDGIVSRMPAPENIRDWVGYAHLFASDGHHLSFHGHEDVAQRVRKIVEEHGVAVRPRKGEFSYKDSCEFWLQSGEIHDLEYSDNGHIINMPNTAKYALEFEGNQGWIRVNNPASIPQNLYVGYMTTGPPPSKYPLAEATIEKNSDAVDTDRPYLQQPPENLPVQLDTSTPPYFGSKSVHISKIVDVGVIPPGKSKVNIRALEQAERPFRLVSVIVTTKAEGNDALDGRLPGGNEQS